MEIGRFDSVKKAEEGVDLVLLDPVTKGDTGAALVLFGMDSSFYKAARAELDARNKALGRPLSPEETREQTAELLARCTKGWRGLTESGKEIPFSQAKAKELYLAYPELADRAAAFIFNRANFFGNASVA